MKSLRALAWVCIALGLALLGADIMTSLEQSEPVVRSAREVLNVLPSIAIAPNSGPTWLRSLMDVPLWAVLGLIGLVATLLVRPID